MDDRGSPPQPCAMRVLAHIRKLDDALGHFLIYISCRCGAHRTAEPEALARLCGKSATLEAVGKRMRCSKCGMRGAQVVAIPIPRPRRCEWLARPLNYGEPSD